MLSHSICNGIWKIEKSPCRSGKDTLLFLSEAAETTRKMILHLKINTCCRFSPFFQDNFVPFFWRETQIVVDYP